jgi:hypothetical protein
MRNYTDISLIELRLSISWEQFSAHVAGRIKATKLLLEMEKACHAQADLDRLMNEIDTWVNETLVFLKQSFNHPNNKYVSDFKNAKRRGYKIPGSHPANVAQMSKDMLADLAAKQQELWSIERILSVCDVIIQNTNTPLDQRLKYSTEEKLTLLIDKFYDLEDDQYYPIREILLGNGIYRRSKGLTLGSI